MSVREQIFLRTDKSPQEVAGILARLVGGEAAAGRENTWLLTRTERLVAGVSGEFGGPVLEHPSELSHRPPGEFEAPDCYNVELRLWQAQGPRLHPTTGVDVENAAAVALFDAVVVAGFTAIHVENDEVLLRANLPGTGAYEFSASTSIYDWDAERWNGFVVVPAES